MAKRVPARRRPGKAKPGTRGLTPAECRLEQSEGAAAEATGATGFDERAEQAANASTRPAQKFRRSNPREHEPELVKAWRIAFGKVSGIRRQSQAAIP